MTRRPVVWPSLEELESRREECRAQIVRRRAILEGRYLASDEPTTMMHLELNDVVLENLRLRLATYDVDIARMHEHELTWLSSDVHTTGGKVWACKCRATGTAPTAYAAMARYNEHVEQAVWGVEK